MTFYHEAIKRLPDLIKQPHTILELTKLQLKEYFEKKRQQFDIPLNFEGTDFQQKTWQALLDIPYGKTISYSEQAIMVGNPKAVRAIGGTNAKNPISIIVPCHRVISKSGKLTGYAGGIKNKEFLLDLEQRYF